MAVRYLNATGTQALINEIKSRLALKADLTSLQALQEALDTVATSIPTKLSQLSNDAEFVTANQVSAAYATKESVTELSGLATQNQDAINLLNANDQTQGSVDYKIAQALEGVGGTPFYDTTLPGSIPGWLAQLPADTTAVNMYIHPTADSNAFKANRSYFAWMMKATIDGAVVWIGIALGMWAEGAQHLVQQALYEIEADTNNYVALSKALTDRGIPEVTLTNSLAPLFELPADVKMVRVVCSRVPAILSYNNHTQEMPVFLLSTGIALRLPLSDPTWKLFDLTIVDATNTSIGTLVDINAYEVWDADVRHYELYADEGAIIPSGYMQVISPAEIRSLFV